MIPYFLILGIVSFWIWLEKRLFNRRAFWIPLLFLALLAGLRSNSVGTDSGTYTWPYVSRLDPKYFEFNLDIEVGYQAIDYALLTFTHNYFWLFFVSAIIVISCHLFIIRKLSSDYFLSVFIYITFGFYTFFFNGLRQGIAMAIYFLAIPFLLKKQFVKYLLVVLIASLFHISAWVMLFFYFLVQVNLKLEYKIIFILLGSTLLSSVIIGYLAQGNDRYQNYTEVAEQAGGYLTLVFYTFIGLFFYFLGSKQRLSNLEYKKMEEIFLCGLALVFPIALLATDPSGPQRVFYYFSSMVIFLIPLIFRTFKSYLFYMIFVFLSLIYFFLITTRLSNLTPYSINSIFEIF